MHDTVKTVRVKPWGEGQGDFVEINESDFDGNSHTLHGEAEPAKAVLAVGKGPGGRIYIKDGKSIHSGPFASEDEANDALGAIG